jgi:hypothetical protein
MKKLYFILFIFSMCIGLTAQDITSNLVAHYTLDNSATDAVGSNNGIITGAKPTSDRFNKDSGAYYFNGLSKIAMGDKTDFQMGTQDFSISVWFKQQHISTYYAYIVGKRGWISSSSDKVYSLLMTPSKEVLFYYRFDDNSTLSHPKSAPIDSTNWHHAVISVDRSDQAKLYIDNKFVSSVDISSKSNIGLNCTNGEFMLGNCTDRNEPLVGSIDEVRVYKGRALNAKDVDTLYNQKATFLNSIANNNSVKVYPNPTTGIITLKHKNEVIDGQYYIYNQYGQVIRQGKMTSNNQEVSIMDLPSGMYHVCCKNNQGTILMFKKVVKL